MVLLFAVEVFMLPTQSFSQLLATITGKKIIRSVHLAEEGATGHLVRPLALRLVTVYVLMGWTCCRRLVTTHKILMWSGVIVITGALFVLSKGAQMEQ